MAGTRPIRVVVLGHTAVLSGAEIALLRLLRSIDSSRISVTVVLFSTGPLVDSLLAAGIEVRVLLLDPALVRAERGNVASFSRSNLVAAFRLVGFVLRLRRLIVAVDADVVHCNSLKTDIIGGVAGRLARRRVVWYVHDRISADYLPRRVASAFRLLARWIPDELIANSRATLATLAPYPITRTTVAYPGVATDAPPNAVDRAAKPAAAGPTITVGMVGRISPTKGQDVFVRAAAEVARTHHAARFAITGAALFGEAAYESDVRALVGDLGLRDVVEFRGHVPDVTTQFDEFAVLVHASPVPEPFGQVVVEAMLAGTPVIATRGGGIEEITGTDGELALLVPPGDTSALARAIVSVLDQPDLARNRARAAQASVRSRFSIATTAAAVTAVWLRAAAGATAPRRRSRRSR